MGGAARDDPRREYEARIGARRARVAHWTGRERAITNARLIVFAAGAALVWWVLAHAGVSRAWLLLPVAVFLTLVILHERVRRARTRAERAVAFYEDGIARLEDRFAGRGRSGDGFADPSHPYATHLDVFGRGSLFERLSRAQTRSET